MYMHLMYLVNSIGCSLYIVYVVISPIGKGIHLSCSFSNMVPQPRVSVLGPPIAGVTPARHR